MNSDRPNSGGRNSQGRSFGPRRNSRPGSSDRGGRFGGSRGNSGPRRSNQGRSFGNSRNDGRRNFGSRRPDSGRRNFNSGRRNFSSSNAPREMHKATCSECGKECEVPFKPTQGKPVYCNECFSKRKRF